MSDRKSFIIERDYDTRVDAVSDGFKAIFTPDNPKRNFDVICADCGGSALGVSEL
jgi:hypothetical protein